MDTNFKKVTIEDLKPVFDKSLKNNKSLSLRVWKKEQKDNISSFKLVTFELTKNLLVLESTSDSQDGKNLIGKILIEILHERDIYFAHGELGWCENLNFYLIKMKKDIFQPIKRKDFRLYASDKLNISLELNCENESYAFEGIDFSASGACIKIPEDKQKTFHIDQFFEPCKLSVNDYVIEVPLVRVVRITKGSDFNIGVEFLKLSPDSESKLAQEVNKELRASLFEEEEE